MRISTSVLHVQVEFSFKLWWFIFFPASSAVKEKHKPKKTIDLFDDDEEDGDIFSEKFSAPALAQSEKEVVEEQGKPPDKKVKISINSCMNYIFSVLYLYLYCVCLFV